MKRMLVVAMTTVAVSLTSTARAEVPVVVVSGDAERGRVERVEAELEAQGFRVIKADWATFFQPETSSAATTPNARPAAALRVRGADAGIEVWIVDPSTSHASLRDLVPVSRGDERLAAMRAVELVRARLIAVDTPLAPSDAERALNPTRVDDAPSSSPPLQTTSEPRRLSVAATFGLTNFLSGRDGLWGRREFLHDVLTQLDISYRFSKRLAVGAVVSYFPPSLPEYRLFRLAGEARVYALSSRFFDVWGAGEAGLAAWKYSPHDCETCDFVPRFGPSFGVGGGVDVLPLPYVSLGLEGRALLPIFFAAPIDGAPAGVTPAFTIGLTLAAHVPLGGSN